MENELKIKLPEKIYGLICTRIRMGEYSPGARIPTVRELAKEYRISNSTAAEAVRQLAEKGWITSSPKRGSIVSPVIPETEGIAPCRESRRDTFYFFYQKQSKGGERCLAGLRKEAGLYHYKVIPCEIENEARMKIILGKIKFNAAGFICTHSFISRAFLTVSRQIPLIVLNAGHHAFGYNEIAPDNYNAGWATAKYLHRHGHKKLGFITSFPPRDPLAGLHFRERLNGFSDYCSFYLLPPPSVYPWNIIQKNGRDVLKEVIGKHLYRSEDVPTAAAVGSLPMLEEIIEYAKSEFDIPDFTRYMSLITYQDRFEDTTQTKADIAMIPLETFTRESIRLLLHLMNPRTAKHHYRNLISMELVPGNTVHQLK